MKLFSILFLILPVLTGTVNAGEWSGSVVLQGQLFNHSPLFQNQPGNNLSLSISPEYYQGWQNDAHSLTIEPFFRLDANDPERTHFDLREFIYSVNRDTWVFSVGVGKVFWGVTEAQHLVDVINQTDLVESLDAEDKLGQPMLHLSLIRDWGTSEFFILPGFRERTFPGEKARLRTSPYIDSSQSQYSSRNGDKHVDYAFRYSHTKGNWDYGFSWFYGTNRDPGFTGGTDNNGQPVLIPVYSLMHQVGLDVQLVSGNWLWKLEAIHRRANGSNYNATTSGFEYTWVGILGSSYDLGLITEYLYDSRGNLAPTLFNKDILLGTRFVFNDTASSEVLLGVVIDPDQHEYLYLIEASTRLNDNWKLNVEARIFSGLNPSSPIYDLRNDDFLQIEFQYYF